MKKYLKSTAKVITNQSKGSWSSLLKLELDNTVWVFHPLCWIPSILEEPTEGDRFGRLRESDKPRNEGKYKGEKTEKQKVN